MKRRLNAELRIGTSGWHYKHWLAVVYPPRIPTNKMLEVFTHNFDTVEVNNSFYQLPSVKTLDSWCATVPKQFRFAVKASRFITHNKKLKDPTRSFEKFFNRAELLGDKLGPILFQLPPRWKINIPRFESFLKALPKGNRYAFEFRDISWLTQPIYDLLREYNSAFCIHDFADMKIPREITADFTYVRFHGPTSVKYAGSYSVAQLRKWSSWIVEKRQSLHAIYVYFNNDPNGAAVQNALTLKRLAVDREN